MTFAVGSLVRARKREWVVLPDSDDEMLLLRPLGGRDDEIAGIFLTLEKVEPGASPTRRPPEGAREILATSLYASSPEGCTPDAVAVAPDGKTLYVANADNNDVVVVDISAPGESRVAG